MSSFPTSSSISAGKHYAAIFAPHLTLAFSETKPVLPRIITSSAIRLCVTGIFSSPVFTKSLFVRFESNPVLEQLRRRLGMKAGAYDPHLSLLYCRLAAAEKSRLARMIKLPFASVGFDTFAVVRCPSPTENQAEIESWQQVACNRLQLPPVQNRAPRR